MKLSIEELKELRANIISAGMSKYATAMDELIAIREAQGVPVAWFTDDNETDKSATTYSKDVADRWVAKGWPVGELFTAPQKLVLRPRIEPCLKQFQFERDCEWIAAIEAAGGIVKDGE